MDLDDNLWVPFVWDTVYTMINNYRQRTSQAPYTYVKHGNIPYCDISLSQIWNSQINIEYHETSDRLCIVPQNQNENSSSIDIENIATANDHHTNTQEQPLSRHRYTIILEQLGHLVTDLIFLRATTIHQHQV